MYPPAVCAQEVCRDGSLLAVCPYAAWGAAPARGDVGSRALRLRGGARALRGNQTAAEGKAAAHTQGGGAGPVPGGGDTSAPLKTKRARRKPRAEGAGGADEAGSGSASSAARLSSSPGRGGAHRADAGAARALAVSLLAEGYTPSRTAKEVASRLKISRNVSYEIVQEVAKDVEKDAE